MRFEVGGGVFVRGRSTFKFSIRSPAGTGEEVYNIAPNSPDNELGIDLVGHITGDIAVFGRFHVVSPSASGMEGEGRALLLHRLFDVPL